MGQVTTEPTASLAQRWPHGLLVTMLVAWGPLLRALMDKGWMQLGGLPLVGQWAQLQGVSDLVSAPALAGIGLGLTVLTAQEDPHRHPALWFTATLLGWVCTAPLALAACFWPQAIGNALGLNRHEQAWIGPMAFSGWLSILWGMLSSYWLGRHRQGRVLLLTLVTAAPGLVALISARGLTPTAGIERVVITQWAIGIAGLLAWLTLWIRWMQQTPNAWAAMKQALGPVARYLPAGFSVGLLTPLSVLAIRGSLAHQLDWDAAGTATALWRVSDWVLSGASGVLYFHYLPRLSQSAQRGLLQAHLFKALRQVWGPSVLALVGLWSMQSWLLPWLYDARLTVDPGVSALFWAGDGLRVLSAVFLFGLYAQQASQTIAWGEWLSQPLLALLLGLGAAEALRWTGWAHLATYAVYASFNAVALHAHWQCQASRPSVMPRHGGTDDQS